MKYYLLHPIKAIKYYFFCRKLKKAYGEIFVEADLLLERFVKNLAKEVIKSMLNLSDSEKQLLRDKE